MDSDANVKFGFMRPLSREEMQKLYKLADEQLVYLLAMKRQQEMWKIRNGVVKKDVSKDASITFKRNLVHYLKEVDDAKSYNEYMINLRRTWYSGGERHTKKADENVAVESLLDLRTPHTCE